MIPAGVDQSLALVSNNLVYSAVLVYALAALGFAAELAVDRRRAGDAAAEPAPADERRGLRVELFGRVAVALTALAFALHAAGVVARGLSAERAPWGNMYEFSVAGSLAVTGVFLALLLRREVRWLGLYVTVAVLATLTVALTVLYTDSADLLPALKSYWLAIHVGGAVVSAGLFSVGALASGLYLVRAARDAAAERAGRAPARRGPSAEALDRVAYQVHTLAFPVWTFTVICGAIWAHHAWGRYWGWDPKEIWAFITWVVYAAYLHARVTAGWKGRAAAWVALLGYATFLVDYYAVNLFGVGLHSYSGL